MPVCDDAPRSGGPAIREQSSHDPVGTPDRRSQPLVGAAPASKAELGNDRAGRLLDVAIVLALAVAAYLTRHGGLPTDGLWHDDAWVATGAVWGGFSELITVGSGHPGFTGLLMIVARLPGGSETLAYPAFAAGVVGPAALYLALRVFGIARSISALLGSALVASWVHILYSGRVKSYVVDIVIVLAVALLLPYLARLYWRWSTALAWVVISIVLGFFSGFALIATAIAGALLVLQPSTERPSPEAPASDRLVRIGAVATQAVAFLGLFAWLQRSSDLAEIETAQEENYDGHLDFALNPLSYGADIADHFGKVAEVFPIGGVDWPSAEWLPLLAALIAVIGLVGGILVPRWRLTSSFFLAIVVFAIVGASVGKFPFGPSGGSFFSRGERATLWLVPIMAFGVALALEWLRSRFAGRTILRAGFDLVVGVLAVVIVVHALGKPTTAYPLPGMESAMQFIESEATDDDAIILTPVTVFPASVEASSGIVLEPRPEEGVPYVPDFDNDRVLPLSVPVDPASLPASITQVADGAERVFVVNALPGFTRIIERSINQRLRAEGFEPSESETFETPVVTIWSRGSLDDRRPSEISGSSAG